MQEFVAIPNKDLSCGTLSEIIELKQQYWNYPYDSQVNWIRENLQDNDTHILFYRASKLVAYLNLINLHVEIDGIKCNMLGVGNVCVALNQRGQGFGKELMSYANKEILRSKKIGLLLCHDNLIPFYQKAGWTELCDVQVTVANGVFNQNIMFFNGQLIDAHKFAIDRNF